jgi:hypothetical protein
MSIEKLTTKPTEADLEAEIHHALKVAFPWLKSTELKHQTRFSFTVGRTSLEIDGALVSKADARSDILIYHGDRPLAVLELKRPRVDLTENDIAQGLSYARMLHPQPPLVVVTNGKDLRILASHTGEDWAPANPSQEELAKLMSAAVKTAEAGIQQAVDVLLGPTSTVWAAAIRASTALTINDLSGEWNDSLVPFVSNFLIPRNATEKLYEDIKRNKPIVILNGPPLVGKSCILRELCYKAAADDTLAILFLEADGTAASGVIQTLANLLADTLGWSVSPEETRTWLRRLSRGTGPMLVLAIDGVGVVRDEMRRDIEELTSEAYGAKLRLVLAVDDTVVPRLVLNETGRKKTRLGRRATEVSVGPLDDAEFEAALLHLSEDHHICFMQGCDSTPEFRIPWILRTLIANFASDPKYQSGLAPLIPSLLGLDLIRYVRKRFQSDHTLLRQFHDVALAVLLDSRDRERPISLILESMSAFVVKSKTLQNRMERVDILSLEQKGYLKPRPHASGEHIFVPRLPELLLSEIALILGNELKQRIVQDVKKAGDWLVAHTANLPLGDLIGAQAILDSFNTPGDLPLDFINHLLTVRPHSKEVRPGTRAAMHVPGAGMLELLFKEDKSIVAKIRGKETIIEHDANYAEYTMYADVQSWLILSYLCRYPLLAQSCKDEQIVGRIDPIVLIEVGACQMVLRRPSGNIDNNRVMTHDLPGNVSIVCHQSGIVEPITLSILEFLGREGSRTTEWLEEILKRNSFPLLARTQIALGQLMQIDDEPTAMWAKKMLNELINPALKNSPLLH